MFPSSTFVGPMRLSSLPENDSRVPSPAQSQNQMNEQRGSYSFHEPLTLEQNYDNQHAQQRKQKVHFYNQFLPQSHTTQSSIVESSAVVFGSSNNINNIHSNRNANHSNVIINHNVKKGNNNNNNNGNAGMSFVTFNGSTFVPSKVILMDINQMNPFNLMNSNGYSQQLQLQPLIHIQQLPIQNNEKQMNQINQSQQLQQLPMILHSNMQQQHAPTHTMTPLNNQINVETYQINNENVHTNKIPKNNKVTPYIIDNKNQKNRKKNNKNKKKKNKHLKKSNSESFEIRDFDKKNENKKTHIIIINNQNYQSHFIQLTLLVQ